MVDLKFDLEAFTRAISEYDRIASEIKDQEEKLKKSIEQLKNAHWKTEAGNAFMDIYNEDWTNNVEEYVAVLNQLSSLLKNARDDYEKVEAEVKKLKFK